MAARRAHNPEVTGSSPVLAKKKYPSERTGFLFPVQGGGLEGFQPLTKGRRRGQEGPGRLKPRPGALKQDVEGRKASPVLAKDKKPPKGGFFVYLDSSTAA